MERIKLLFKMWVPDDTDPALEWFVWRPWARNVGYGMCGAVGASLVIVPVWIVVVEMFR